MESNLALGDPQLGWTNLIDGNTQGVKDVPGEILAGKELIECDGGSFRRRSYPTRSG